jgi:hypothetical protein
MVLQAGEVSASNGCPGKRKGCDAGLVVSSEPYAEGVRQFEPGASPQEWRVMNSQNAESVGETVASAFRRTPSAF